MVSPGRGSQQGGQEAAPGRGGQHDEPITDVDRAEEAPGQRRVQLGGRLAGVVGLLKDPYELVVGQAHRPGGGEASGKTGPALVGHDLDRPPWPWPRLRPGGPPVDPFSDGISYVVVDFAQLRTSFMVERQPRPTDKDTTMPELLVDFITSLDGYAAADGWPGWWGLEGPEYSA